MRRFIFTLILWVLTSTAFAGEPLPIDPLWKSENFRKAITGSYGIDSRIEPRLTEDESEVLDESAELLAAKKRRESIEYLTDSGITEKSPAILFSLATLLFEEGESEKSIERFHEALELFPNFRDAHRNLAVVLVQEEKWDGAESHLIRAIELGARDGLSLGLLGYCHSRKDRAAAALDAYRQAAMVQPDEAQWKSGQAQALQMLGKHAEAVSIFQELIEEDPQTMQNWLAQAESLITLDEPIKAIANLELAHRAGRLGTPQLFSLGHLYLQNELLNEGYECYLNALRPESGATMRQGADALGMLINRQEWALAGKLLEICRELPKMGGAAGSSIGHEHSSEDRSRYFRSVALIEAGNENYERGIAGLDAYLQQEPLDGEALLLRARLHRDAGHREEAEMRYEEAALVEAVAPDAFREHGELLVDARDYAKAIELLERSLALEPSDAVARFLDAVKELD